MRPKIGIITLPWFARDAKSTLALVREFQNMYPGLDFGLAGIGKHSHFVENPMLGAQNIRAAAGGTEPITILSFQAPSSERAALEPGFDWNRIPTGLDTPWGLETQRMVLGALAQWANEGIVVQRVTFHTDTLQPNPPEGSDEERFIRVVENLATLADAFPQFQLCIENMPGGPEGTLMGDLETDWSPDGPPWRRVYETLALGGISTGKLVEAVGRRNVQVCWDICHEACQPEPPPLMGTLQTLKESLEVIHVAGGRWLPGQASEKILFEEGLPLEDGYYSEEDIREALRTAADRGVPLIPEPGETDFAHRPRMGAMVGWLAQQGAN